MKWTKAPPSSRWRLRPRHRGILSAWRVCLRTGICDWLGRRRAACDRSRTFPWKSPCGPEACAKDNALATLSAWSKDTRWDGRKNRECRHIFVQLRWDERLLLQYVLPRSKDQIVAARRERSQAVLRGGSDYDRHED